MKKLLSKILSLTMLSTMISVTPVAHAFETYTATDTLPGWTLEYHWYEQFNQYGKQRMYRTNDNVNKVDNRIKLKEGKWGLEFSYTHQDWTDFTYMDAKTVIPASKLEANTEYDFTYWICRRLCGQYSVLVNDVEKDAINTNDWNSMFTGEDGEYKTFQFATGDVVSDVTLTFRMYRGYADWGGGFMWIDDVSFRKVGDDTNLVTNGGFEDSFISDFKAVSNGTNAVLTWNENADVTNATISQKREDGSWTVIGTVDGGIETYTVENLADESVYTFGITYESYSKAEPDCIWIDDDVRINPHDPIMDGCYCDKCIKRFNEEYGRNYISETLIEALDANNETIQKEWDEFRENLIIETLETIKNAVSSINPGIEIGFMSSYLSEKPEWMRACGSTLARPGGGYYEDNEPRLLFEKFFSVNKQIECYPKNIKDIQYEFEAFNYQTLQRSIHISELETSLAVMSGCNGVMYNNNIFCDDDNITEMLRNSQDKWSTLVKLNKNCHTVGVFCVNRTTALYLQELSIPVTACYKNACAAMVLGNDIINLSDEEIEKILDLSLYTDGLGLKILCDKGFGNRCGGNVEKVYHSGMAERFSQHNINGEFCDYYRDIFMNSTLGGDAYELKYTDAGECISNLETITHVKGGCSCYIHKGVNGSRFAADGYMMLK